VFHRIEVPFALSSGKFGDIDETMTLGIQVKLSGARFHTPEEEIA
jgi:NAD+ synthase (glutamine-hydrolysing)